MRVREALKLYFIDLGAIVALLLPVVPHIIVIVFEILNIDRFINYLGHQGAILNELLARVHYKRLLDGRIQLVRAASAHVQEAGTWREARAKVLLRVGTLPFLNRRAIHGTWH